MEELVKHFPGILRKEKCLLKKVKMKNFEHYIFALITALVFVGCTDDENDMDNQDIEFCVRAAWQNGLDNGNTRALTTDILADGPDNITISHDDYPVTINVKCSDNTDFILSKATDCSNHSGFMNYTSSVTYTEKMVKRYDLTFDATASIDDSRDVLEGQATQNDIVGKHLQLTLHHTKALLRFAFKVSEKYDKVRYIRVSKIKLNNTDCELVDKVLSKDNQFIAYIYIDPTKVTTDTNNTIQCTYNIYDKDDANDEHLTRKGVVAKNIFKLSSLKDKNGNSVTEIKSGYYYDLKVTLNPDYLYVLSEHDNKHITIN